MIKYGRLFLESVILAISIVSLLSNSYIIINDDDAASLATDILSPFSSPSYQRFRRDKINKTFNTHGFSETHRPTFRKIPKISIKQIIDATTSSDRWALATLSIIENPLNTFSILEPYHSGTCGRYFSTRATVVETVKHRNGGCMIAQNAGFFRTSNGKCLGNIVTDGKFIQNSGNKTNANFGIRSSGEIFVGYISDRDVVNITDPFVQLLSGVIWLVRNGTNYVNSSIIIESDYNEETGNLTEFASVVSARTALGHDSNGRVIMVMVEGQTGKRGVNLFELADLLINHGVINAINLDGGGSATLVKEGQLASHPSDHCSDPIYRCPRAVSTIICMHNVSCIPSNCNGHGSCINSKCICSSPWYGSDCSYLNCSLTNCSNNGNCYYNANNCECDESRMGELCEKSCPSNYYGKNCLKWCFCSNNGRCSPITGKCMCIPGYQGYGCLYKCPLGTYGLDCKNKCFNSSCSDHEICHYVMGCICDVAGGILCNSSTIYNATTNEVKISNNSIKQDRTENINSSTIVEISDSTSNKVNEIEILGIVYSENCYNTLILLSILITICGILINVFICCLSWLICKVPKISSRSHYINNNHVNSDNSTLCPPKIF